MVEDVRQRSTTFGSVSIRIARAIGVEQEAQFCVVRKNWEGGGGGKGGGRVEGVREEGEGIDGEEREEKMAEPSWLPHWPTWIVRVGIVVGKVSIAEGGWRRSLRWI